MYRSRLMKVCAKLLLLPILVVLIVRIGTKVRIHFSLQAYVEISTEVDAGPDLFVLKDNGTIIIAIGGGITSKGSKINVASLKDNETILFDLPFFSTLLSSFCRAASGNVDYTYDYRFYWAYDRDDMVYNNTEFADSFQRTFVKETVKHCEPLSVKVSLHFVRHDYDSGHPNRAQNEAMREAYFDGADFFYRINDDTQFVTPGWTDTFIRVLNGYNPPLVGVVGPWTGAGTADHLTYEFVHRTHIDIFGFFYPVSGIFGDLWTTRVYTPSRWKKMMNITLAHTMVMSTRHVGASSDVAREVNRGKLTLNRYLAANTSTKHTQSRRIIAVTLSCFEAHMTWGAIRNAHLASILLPDWKICFYVPSTKTLPTGLLSNQSDVGINRMTAVKKGRVIATLRRLGAEVKHIVVHSNHTTRDVQLFYHLLNRKDIDYVLLRQADWRLSEREVAAVRDWVRVAELIGSSSNVVHCIHDHISQAQHAVVDNLWGFRPRALQRLLAAKKTAKTTSETREQLLSGSNDSFFEENIWPLVAGHAYCHDSITLTHGGLRARRTQPFPKGTSDSKEFVGQLYDQYQDACNETTGSVSNHCSNACGW